MVVFHPPGFPKLPLVTPDQVRSAGEQIAENGRVLATLDDWRAMAFVFVIVLLMLVGIIVVLLRSTRLERKDMADERARLWGLAGSFGDAAGKMTAELQVTQALNARVETALKRCEDFQSGRP